MKNKIVKMNINPRKPLHSNKNFKTLLDANISQKIPENSNVTEEDQASTESGSDFYDDEIDTTYSNTECTRQELFEISGSVPRSPQQTKRLKNRSPSVQPVHKKPTRPLQQDTSKSSSLLSILAFIVSAIILGVYALGSPSYKYCSYEKLQNEYPKQTDNLWRILKVGIESILNGRTHSPAVYLFVHHGGANVFQLVKDIAKHSSECFGPRMRPIEIESSDFKATSGTDDYGYVIEKYRAKIKEGNVFLIANLNEIPPEAARALHAICDTYSPIAENVVIFLTLTIPPIAEGTVVSNAENTLNELWSPKLDRNELDPLITRVTDQVIALQS